MKYYRSLVFFLILLSVMRFVIFSADEPPEPEKETLSPQNITVIGDGNSVVVCTESTPSNAASHNESNNSKDGTKSAFPQIDIQLTWTFGIVCKATLKFFGNKKNKPRK